MKHLVFPLALFLILVSCKSEPETTEVDAERLIGEFVRVRDNDRGGKENKTLIETITFRSKFCNFTYDGTPMSGKYSVDEGYVYIEAGGDLGTLSLEIISADQLEGEGFIHGTFAREGHEGEVSGNGSSGGESASSGSGSNGASSGSDNASGNGTNASGAGAEEKSSGSTGGGQKNTTTNGSNSGTSGSGASSGTATEKRYVVQHLNTSNMRAGASATVALVLTINADGMVVGTQLDRSRTTTNNEVLVNSVTDAVKKEVKYNKVPGAANTRVSYTVKL